MARHFLRLKFRITANTIRGGDVWSLLGQVLIWGGAVVSGLGLGLLLALGIEFFPGPPVLAVLAGALLQIGWVVIPLLAASLDTTLDARDFELLPIDHRELGRGLLLAGATGPGGLLTVLVVGLGLGVGLWPGVIGVIVVPVLLVLLAFVCVVSGRLISALVSEGLARARAGAIASGAVAVVALLAAFGAMAAPQLAEAGFDNGLPSATGWLAILPGGAVAGAFQAVHDGAWGQAVGYTAWGLLAGAGMAWVYGWWLARMRSRSVTAAPGRVRGDGTTLGSGLQRLIRSAPLRAMAAKEFRYLRRDPRLRAQLFGGVVTVLIFGFVSFGLLQTPYAPFLAVLATWALISTVVPNQFGVDAKSFWAYVVNPTDLSTALLGKNLAWATLAVPVTLVVGLAASIAAGTFAYLPAALIAAVAVFLIWMAVGNVTSIYGAFPLPEKQLFGSGPKGGRVVVVALIGLAVSGVLTGPVVAAIGVPAYFGGPFPATLGAIGGVVYAAVLFRVALTWARGLVVERRLLLLQALDQA